MSAFTTYSAEAEQRTVYARFSSVDDLDVQHTDYARDTPVSGDMLAVIAVDRRYRRFARRMQRARAIEKSEGCIG